MSAHGDVTGTPRSLDAILPKATLAARLALTGIWFLAAYPKLINPASFAINVRNYRLLSDSLSQVVAVGVPVFEIVLGVALLIPAVARGAALVSALLFAAFGVLIGQALVRGIELSCGCFGTGGGAPANWLEVARDVLFLALAAFVVVFQRQPAPSRNSNAPTLATA